MQMILAVVAGAGFLACLIGHIALRLGYDLYGEAWSLFFFGIFVVWLPTVLTLRKFGSAMQRRGGWKIALIGAPDWAKYVVGAAFVYAIANFVLEMLGSFRGAGEASDNFWNVGPSHAMAFYSAAWGAALAAANREKTGLEWRCERGHDLTPGAKFCEECGAPAVHSQAADA